MNAQQEARLSMYLSNIQHLDENSTIFDANTAFKTAFTSIKTKLGTLQNKAQLSDLSILGIAAGKKTAKETAAEKTADTAGILFAFADATGNEQLKAEVNYTARQLLRLKDSLFALRCRNIHDLAVANKAALLDYGITDETIEDLQSAIDAYVETVPKPRTAKSNKKTLNADIAELFKDIDKIYENQLDKLIVNFKASNPDFVETYFDLRKVIDPSTTATQLKGVVTAASSGTPVNNADVIVMELAKTTKTDAAGKYSFKPIPNGKFTIKVIKAGFVDFEALDVEVKLGEIKHLDVEMVSN